MSRLLRGGRAALLMGLVLVLWAPGTAAHGIVGKRMFIEPLVTEDANVKNELDLPRGEFLVQGDGTWRSFGFSLEKELYPHRFSVVLEDDRLNQHVGGQRLQGWDNLQLGLKWQAFTNVPHELVVSPALFLTFPTGSTKVTSRQTAFNPMVLYGKGFGDLSAPWLRPLALQGDFGFAGTVSGPRDRQLVYDDVLMYSIPYLNRWVRDADSGYSMEDNLRRGFSAGAVFGNLYPFAEFNATTAVAGTGGGTISYLRPGVAWMGKYAQVSIAADIPLQPGAATGHTGVALLVDWFLDDIFPKLNWTPFGRR